MTISRIVISVIAASVLQIKSHFWMKSLHRTLQFCHVELKPCYRKCSGIISLKIWFILIHPYCHNAITTGDINPPPPTTDTLRRKICNLMCYMSPSSESKLSIYLHVGRTILRHPLRDFELTEGGSEKNVLNQLLSLKKVKPERQMCWNIMYGKVLIWRYRAEAAIVVVVVVSGVVGNFVPNRKQWTSCMNKDTTSMN